LWYTVVWPMVINKTVVQQNWWVAIGTVDFGVPNVKSKCTKCSVQFSRFFSLDFSRPKQSV